MEAVGEVVQKRSTPETGTVLGSGKLEEARLAAQQLGAQCAVFDGELTAQPDPQHLDGGGGGSDRPHHADTQRSTVAP